MVLKSLRLILKIIFAFAGLIALYLTIAFFTAYIPVNTDFSESDEGIEIFVISNGVHTDICFPIKQAEEYWRETISFGDFDGSVDSFQYLSFGWGDKGFYLNTPTWADLKFSTAVNAALLPSSTAMHVSVYDFRPAVSDNVKNLKINEEEFKKLQQLILQSFQIEEGKAVYIPGYRYPNLNDNFYEAKGSYSLFKTCNSWTNNVLKSTGIKTALWSPFDWGILKQLQKD